jgi:hypothetical protein
MSDPRERSKRENRKRKKGEGDGGGKKFLVFVLKYGLAA